MFQTFEAGLPISTSSTLTDADILEEIKKAVN
jgi:hypothetical protein